MSIGTVTKVTGGVTETISGCTFTATVTDTNPDAMGITIYKPDGTLYYSAGSKAVKGGNYTIGDSVYYYHNDHLATPMMMTDGGGNTVWQGEFKPFGELFSVTGTVDK